MLRHIYDKYVVLPESDDAYKQKVIGFIENYEFPCPQFAMAFTSILIQNWKITIPLRKGIWFQIGGW